MKPNPKLAIFILALCTYGMRFLCGALGLMILVNMYEGIHVPGLSIIMFVLTGFMSVFLGRMLEVDRETIE